MAEKDMTEKNLESFDEVFSDIINGFLFQGKDKVDKDSLVQATARSVYKADQKLREQERDTAKYWNNVNFHIAFFGVENETEPTRDIPLRIIGYDGAAYRDQLFYEKDENEKRKMNENPRCPVVTLLLYFGYKKHWDKPITLYESLDTLTDDLKPYVNDYKVNLFEVAWLTDEQLAYFKSDFRIVADYFVQMRKNKDYVPSNIQMTHVREVLQLMSVLTKDNRFEEAYNEFEEGKEIRYMSEVLDRVENRGINKGIQTGLQRGRILEYIDLRREDGYSDEKLIDGLIRKFQLTAEQAKEYVQGLVTV